jgi:predicted nucleic acid-binding protein
LDTGPIVAVLNARDPDHARSAAILKDFRGRFVTTEAVLTEAVYLLSRIRGGADACLEFFIRGGAHLVPQSGESLIRAKELMRQYENVPMDFADATLVGIAEEAGLVDIFTLDKRGFSTYRPARRRRFRIVP